MTQKLVECVPNVSEGNDPRAIAEITAVLGTIPGVTLLDVDPGKETNRTVITFVGDPAAVVEGAYRLIKRAGETIDMRRHKGAHPRIGATDVCPFVPVTGVTMEECAALARALGERVGRDLRIPVYLYEAASSAPARKNLADIRKGEYEGLEDKLRDRAWKPDFGPAAWNDAVARTGATVIGARPFLIAYNVNLNTKDKRLATEIALRIREGGRARRDGAGEIVRNPDGTPVKEAGLFKSVKAVGWFIPEYHRAQVSINLTDFTIAPPHAVFDACVAIAAELGLRVTGSELVGLIPREALLAAGRHYLSRQKRTTGAPEAEIVETAIQSLGLADLGPFDPAKKVIEYRVGQGRDGRLASMTVRGFADELSTDSPAPGGGSVAALLGSLSAALSCMVANLTYGKKGYESATAEMERLAASAQALKDALLADVDRDTDAFNAVIDAMRMPKVRPEEVASRDAALAAAYRHATEVPLSVLVRARDAARLASLAASRGNRSSLSDAGVASIAALAAAEGAYLNVLINLPQVAPRDRSRLKTRAAKAIADVRSTCRQAQRRVGAALSAQASGKRRRG
ncbi:MAG: glutamate formimidoyltransferase [Acidobacteriota bacterium]